MRRTTLKLALLVGACAVALVVVGASSGAKNAPHAKALKTLVFGTASDPVVLDGSLVSDGESLRVIDQMFESLVSLRPGTTKVQPQLATKWKADKSGKHWTFTLRKGVKFHDGTKFNAAAVCYNFNRWYNYKGPFQSADATYYWQAIFLGFKKNESDELSPSLYKGCKAKGQYSVLFTLAKPFGPFVPALSLTNFAIASPKALKKYGANKAELRNGVFTPTGSYGFKHPTGTGPFKFKSWRISEKLEIVRNANYWGKKAKLGKVVFVPIGNNTARLQALQSGDIMGYDLVAPQDYAKIRSNSGLKLLKRPAFNVAYVTMHQGQGSPMNDKKVRQAVAYGLNRAGLIKIAYPPGAVVAKEFQPPQLFGYAKKGVKTYGFNPSKARQLLNSSSCHVPCKVDFWYPSSVSRPYMPDPKRNFEVFSASLEQSGFNVTPHTANWRPDYVAKVSNGTAGDLNLIGWTGDYGDPDNFLGVFFGTYSEQFNFKDAAGRKIFNILQKARTETNQAKRAKIYQKANKMIMDYLPAVPYAHTSPALGFRKSVKGYKTSPVSIEPFSIVSVGGV